MKPMTAFTSTPSERSRAWTVTLKTNGMTFPNWFGERERCVLVEASSVLKQPIHNLLIHPQGHE